MIRLLPLLMILAQPATAGTLETLHGRWQGEGQILRGTEPAERLRCQIRLEPMGRSETFFVGRCATAQGSSSFTYALRESADGTLIAENRENLDTDLPDRMQGRTEPGLVSFQTQGGGLFELRREGAALRLTVEGRDSRGEARGEALLTLRE